MFSSFLKITLRNLYREKIYAFINISGLSIAIACCLILGLWLRSELTYDQHHTKHRQIYRVENEFNINGKVSQAAMTSQYLGPILFEEHPGIKAFVRFKSLGTGVLLRHEDKAFYWEDIYSADNNVFDVFSHNIIYGNPKTALLDPNSITVSESLAKKHFGDSNPVGKSIMVNGTSNKITLVFADLPENSHLKYTALLSYNDQEMPGPFSGASNPRRLWFMLDFTYLLMPEDYNIQDFKDISDSFYERHMKDFGEKTYNGSWRCWLQPLVDVHYNSKVQYDLPAGNKFYIYGFAAVAIFIILVACINYMNLSTARAAKRAKEVGMRKILGSGRTRLVLHFTSEAILFSLISMFLGYALVELILNLTPINELLGKSLSLNLLHEPNLLMWTIVFSLLLGLMSGIYPALYLSSALPLSTLVGSVRASSKGSIRLRGGLVLVQFTISVCVIACTLLMFLQMQYMSNKSLGFNKENRLIIPMRGADLIEKFPTIEKELLKDSSVLGVALGSSKLHNTASFAPFIDNKDCILERLAVSWMIVGNDFIDVLGMELTAGRDFSKELLTDASFPYIINEAVVNKMGWEQPLGKRIQPTGGKRNGKVIGVVKDFHHQSLKSEINPLIMGLFSGIPQNQPRLTMVYYLYMNIDRREISRTLDFLKEKFEEFDPEHPFEFVFLSDSLNNLYISEQHLMKLTGIFATVCIFISCLGLFGLIAFSTEQRSKEIGIRKVLGASTFGIITMLVNRILLLVLGGSAIASLVAFYAMDEWVTGFAYHTDIELWIFFVAAAVATGVVFITVALQSYKTATANPVKALRYE